MSKFRTELENLFLKILEEPDTKRANDNTLRILVEYAKITPEPVSILDNMPLSDSMLRSFALMTDLLKPKNVDFVSIRVNAKIADAIIEANPELIEKITEIKDTQGNTLMIHIKK